MVSVSEINEFSQELIVDKREGFMLEAVRAFPIRFARCDVLGNISIQVKALPAYSVITANRMHHFLLRN